MNAKIAVISHQKDIIKKLTEFCKEYCDVQFNLSQLHTLTMAIVDATTPDLESVLSILSKENIYVVLMSEENSAELSKYIESPISKGSDLSLVDDVLLLPLRKLEVRSKINHFYNLSKYRVLSSTNQNIKILIEKMKEDLDIARGIQKKFIPEKFNIPGFKITHKYIAGIKAGGDYFDVFEFDDRTHVGILMSDSTGYGLSSALISVMLRMAFRFGRGEPESPSRTLGRVFEELRAAMKDSEELAIFYGVLNKHTLQMTYAHAGDINLFADHERHTVKSVDPGRRAKSLKLQDEMITFKAGSRITLATDGYVNAVGGVDGVEELIKRTSQDDAFNFTNELSFAVKKDLQDDDALPLEDCSVVILDIEKRSMRLVKG